MLSSSNSTFVEAELVQRLKEKDRAGFEQLYDAYSAALYGVSLKIVRSEEIAQDCLQDSFVKIWKNIAKYDPKKGRLFTWMLNITRNTAIDKTRSKSFQQNAQFKAEFDSERDSKATSKIPVDHIGLDKAIHQLKPEQQEVIDIIYFKGYTHTEAAEALNLPLGTLKTRIKIAIRELKKLTH